MHLPHPYQRQRRPVKRESAYCAPNRRAIECRRRLCKWCNRAMLCAFIEQASSRIRFLMTCLHRAHLSTFAMVQMRQRKYSSEHDAVLDDRRTLRLSNTFSFTIVSRMTASSRRRHHATPPTLCVLSTCLRTHNHARHTFSGELCQANERTVDDRRTRPALPQPTEQSGGQETLLRPTLARCVQMQTQ